MAASSEIVTYALITLLLGHHLATVGCEEGDTGEEEDWDALLKNKNDDDDGESSSNCHGLTMDSPWEDQIKMRNCHYSTHTHPRMMPRKRRTVEEQEEFHHLAIFNIRYDLDFQESGSSCSVRLQDEWLHGLGERKGPIELNEFSYNRIWYKRLCNFFSYLECIPINELRTKSRHDLEELAAKRLVTVKSIHEKHRHPAALPDGHSHLPLDKTDDDMDTTDDSLSRPTANPNRLNHQPLLEYEDSNRSTVGMVKLKIGGRGPGKGRHKSGPGGSRVDVMEGERPKPFPSTTYPLDGICACSAFDPKYPERKRPDYGIDFVEDQSRSRWCVAAPGNLCGRVYFRKNLWPGQTFEMSDHIGCPKKYNGKEYECIRWQLESNKYEDDNLKELPNTMTSTCEIKKKDDDI